MPLSRDGYKTFDTHHLTPNADCSDKHDCDHGQQTITKHRVSRDVG